MDSGPDPQRGPGPDPAYQPTVTGPAVPGNPPSAPPPGGGFAAHYPYPYPGAQSQPIWPPAPAAAPPPARPRRRRGWLVTLAVAVVAALVAAGATAAVLRLSKPESPTQMALESGRALAPAAGLTLTGSIGGAPATVTVTRAGTVEADYTQGQDRLSLVTIGGVSYVKAPASFWAFAEGGSDTATNQAQQQAPGRWAKVPAGRVMSFAAFTPGQISRVLEQVGQHPRAASVTFGGTKVTRVTVRGVSYYITSSRPNRLIHVTEAGRYSLDVTPLNAATIGPVFTILHGDVQGFQGSPEPVAQIVPQQKIQFHTNCNGSTTCTVSIKVRVTDPISARDLLRMTVSFSGTKNGRAFATCTGTVSLNPAATVAPGCELGKAVWSKWVNSHTSNFNTWASPAFTVTINTAGDIAAMQDELSKEQAA